MKYRTCRRFENRWGVRDMRTLGSQVKQTVTAHTVTDEIHTWGGKIRPTNGGAVWGPRLCICRTLERTCRKAFVNLQVTQDNTGDRDWRPLCSCVLVSATSHCEATGKQRVPAGGVITLTCASRCYKRPRSTNAPYLGCLSGESSNG